MSTEKKIRCAVVGYGAAFSMGKLHGQWIHSTPGLSLVAVCDRDAARAESATADFEGLSIYTELSECVASPDVDLVVIVTPHNTHFALALEALKAGKHVVLEKPMCFTASEATELIDAAKQSGVMLTVFHNRRRDGDFLAIKEVVDKGIIGDVFQIEAFMGGYQHPGYWWRSDKAISGGAFYDWGAHVVDWVLQLIPEKIESVLGIFHKRVWTDVTNEDHTQAIVRFAGGRFADIQMSSIAQATKPRWRILGTKGAIVVEDWESGLKILTRVGEYPAEMKVPFKESDWAGWYPALAAHLLDGSPLEVTPESARRVICVIETAEKSAKSGKSEPVQYE